MLEGIGEDFGFDIETCSEIASLPLIDAIEMVYSYLVQAGFDPEDVLSDFLEISESSNES